MQNQACVTPKPATHFEIVKLILWILGIAVCFTALFFVLGKYTYNEVGKLLNNLPVIVKYLTAFILNAAISILSYNLLCCKKKTRLVYAVPFMVAIISTVLYWQGFLRITDPTNPQSIHLYDLAVKSAVPLFCILSLAGAVVIAFAVNRISKSGFKAIRRSHL